MPDRKLTDSKKIAKWQKEKLGDKNYNEIQEKAKHDTEIKKALKDWIKNYDGSYINFRTLAHALDLINHLQAENERLEHQLETLCLTLKLAKFEAYKECIQKIKVKSKKEHLVCSGASLRTDYTITDKELNNLLKELVGEDNA